MVAQLSGLTETEQNLTLNAIPLITVLIAGADGEIDREERNWASKLTKIRSFSEQSERLNEYYETIYDNLPNQIDLTTAGYNGKPEAIAEELSQLNAIFPKLDPYFAKDLYDSYISFAEQIAKASGGFLRIGAISSAEAKWMKLPMLTPVEAPIEPEEDLEEDVTE